MVVRFRRLTPRLILYLIASVVFSLGGARAATVAWSAPGAAGLAPQADGPVSIDAQKREACWHHPLAAAGTVTRETGEILHLIYLACDEENLYLFCEGPVLNPAYLQAKAMITEDAAFRTDDYLSAECELPDGRAFRIEVNPAGIWRERIRGADGVEVAARLGVRVAARLDAEGWMLEVAWPLTPMGLSIGDRVGMRFRRQESKSGREYGLDLANGNGVALGAQRVAEAVTVEGQPGGRGRVRIQYGESGRAASAVRIRFCPLGEGKEEEIRIPLPPVPPGRKERVEEILRLPAGAVYRLELSWERDGAETAGERIDLFTAWMPARRFLSLDLYEAWNGGMGKRLEALTRRGGEKAAGRAIQEAARQAWAKEPMWRYEAPPRATRLDEAPDWDTIAPDSGAAGLDILLDLAEAGECEPEKGRTEIARQQLLAWMGHERVWPGRTAAAKSRLWNAAASAKRAENCLAAARSLFLKDPERAEDLVLALTSALESERAAYALALAGGADSDTLRRIAQNAEKLRFLHESEYWISDTLRLARERFQKSLYPDAGSRSGAWGGEAAEAFLLVSELTESGALDGPPALPWLRRLACFRLPEGGWPRWGPEAAEPDVKEIATALQRHFPKEAALFSAFADADQASAMAQSFPEEDGAGYGGDYALSCGKAADSLRCLVCFRPARTGERAKAGSILIQTNGRSLLADPVAREEGEAAGNSLRMDGNPASANAMPPPGLPLPWRWITSPVADMIAGEWNANDSALGERTVLAVKEWTGPGAIYLFDRLDAVTDEAHNATRLFQLAPEVKAETGSGGAKALRPDGKGLRLLLPEAWDGALTMENGLVRRGQEETAAPAIRLTEAFSGRYRAPLAWVSEEGATGVRLRYPAVEGAEWALVEWQSGVRDWIGSGALSGAGARERAATGKKDAPECDGRFAFLRERGGALVACLLVDGTNLSFRGKQEIRFALEERASFAFWVAPTGEMVAELQGDSPAVTGLTVSVRAAKKGGNEPEREARLSLQPGQRVRFRPF